MVLSELYYIWLMTTWDYSMHIYILCTLTRTQYGIPYKNTLVFETLLNAEQLALKPMVQIIVFELCKCC